MGAQRQFADGAPPFGLFVGEAEPTSQPHGAEDLPDGRRGAREDDLQPGRTGSLLETNESPDTRGIDELELGQVDHHTSDVVGEGFVYGSFEVTDVTDVELTGQDEPDGELAFFGSTPERGPAWPARQAGVHDQGGSIRPDGVG